MAQRIRHLTTNQGIAGSSPARVKYFLKIYPNWTIWKLNKVSRESNLFYETRKLSLLFIWHMQEVAWPSGLRRWFKAPVSSGAWVRIPPLPDILPINFVQVPNSSTYFIEKWPFLEGSCQNFWHWEGKYAGCWGCGGEMYEQWKKFQGTHGFEPWTYRTAADCSTTELYPQHMNITTKFVVCQKRLIYKKVASEVKLL